MVARGWTEAQKRAYVLADNKLALNAGWDEELLRVELTDLSAMGADLNLIGFADDELAELFARPERRPDRSGRRPGAAARRRCRVPGDVWLLGRHRLVCGDSTDR